MDIHILFTIDVWKSNHSRVLRGVFTDNTILDLDKAKQDLIDNEVVSREEEIEIVTIQDGTYCPDGGYF